MKKLLKYLFPIGIAGMMLNLLLFVTNWYYELVVPVIENSDLEDGLFLFLDVLIYITPVIAIVIFAALTVAGQIYMRKVHAAEEVRVTEELMQKNEAVKKELDEKAEFLKHEYYTNCPNCGSARVENTSVCSFCGASLIKGGPLSKDGPQTKNAPIKKEGTQTKDAPIKKDGNK